MLPGEWERPRRSFRGEVLPGTPKRKRILERSNSISKSLTINMITSGSSKKFPITEKQGMKHDKARV